MFSFREPCLGQLKLSLSLPGNRHSLAQTKDGLVLQDVLTQQVAELGVAIDTAKQIQTYVISQRYEGMVRQ